MVRTGRWGEGWHEGGGQRACIDDVTLGPVYFGLAQVEVTEGTDRRILAVGTFEGAMVGSWLPGGSIRSEGTQVGARSWWARASHPKRDVAGNTDFYAPFPLRLLQGSSHPFSEKVGRDLQVPHPPQQEPS